MPKTNPNAGRKLFDGKPEKAVLSKLEDAFAFGATDEEACLYAGISVSALHRYQENHPEFRERKELLKMTPVLQARESVVSGLKGSPELSLKFLERKVKSEFSLRQELTGADGKDLPTPILSTPAKDDEPTEEPKPDVSTDDGTPENPTTD